MHPRITQLKQSERTRILASTFLFIDCAALIWIFASYYRTRWNLSNPLIPKELADYAFWPFALKGLILSVGLPLALAFRLSGQNVASVVVSLISLALAVFSLQLFY